MNQERKFREIGAIVADNYATAEVFAKYKIDYYCAGERTLEQAAHEAGISLEILEDELDKVVDVRTLPFGQWPVDLIIDYVLKTHHRNIRSQGLELLQLVQKVARVHGDQHPELRELEHLFEESLDDLLQHLVKEEQVLFPYLLELWQADEDGYRLEPMHCGSVIHPIGVMRMEHESEGRRYTYITQLTSGYTAPEGSCQSYRKMMADLKHFMNALFEHIHIENNIIFPKAIELEERCVG